MAPPPTKSRSPPLKRAKLSKGAMFKPPTSEELNTLKETDSLYRSNLFRLQMGELISEVQVNETKKRLITETLQELNDVLMNLPSQDVDEITDLAWCAEDVKYPTSWERSLVKGHMSFHKPASVKVVGSFLLDILTQPDLSIDLAVEMPQACRQPKDYLNFRYHHKRALYCVYLATQLRGHNLIEEVKYCWQGANHMRPLVVVKLAGDGKTVKHIQVNLYPCLPVDNFKKSRLLPSKSNICRQWYTGNKDVEETFPSTPHYNSSLLADMAMESHLHCLYNAATDFPGFKDGILLLKVWLRQRQLDKGGHAFSGFIMSMLVAYLLSKRVLNKLMSGYQVFRNVVHYLAGCDWTTDGITLCTDTSDKDLPTTKEFHQYFDVVFLDSSGYLNLCADMTTATFQQVRHEANLAKVYLDSPSLDGFDCLFMTPVPFARKFDHIFHLDNLSQLRESCKHFKQLEEGSLIDHGGDHVRTCLPRLLKLLHRGLGSRVNMIAVHLQEDKQWNISDAPPNPDDLGPLTFGLLLDPEFAGSVLERGPEANTPEAEKFQRFWGERSELRRFQDGSICEAVVWSGQTIAETRLVCSHVIKHLLKIHAGISPDTLNYIGGQLDPILSMPGLSTSHPTPDSRPHDTPDSRPHDTPDSRPHDTPDSRPHDTPASRPHDTPASRPHDTPDSRPHDTPDSRPHDTPDSRPHDTPDSRPQQAHPATGEESNVAMLQVYNELSKELRGLKGFPLVMTSVQGISPALRYTEVFPPTPVHARRSASRARLHGYVQVPIFNQPCPEWVPAIKVICQLEGSGKWPDDLPAIERIKAAFHIRLADMLHKQCGLVTFATPAYLDVLKEGFVFRVEVAHRREIGLLKETYTPDGMKMLRDNPQSVELERRTVMLPRLTSILYGIQQQHPSYSVTVRLAKRWVCSQLLSNHVPDETIDLLVALLFLQPAPHTVPGSPLVGFLRFLHLLSTHDWQSAPVIINFNDEMQDSDYDEIRQHFTEHRSQLPPMFIATPTDKLHSLWSQKQPTAQILWRLTVLAKESLRVLTSQMMGLNANTDFKQIFRPPLDLYDVVIHLRPKLVPRREEVVDGSRVPVQRSANEGSLTEKSSQLPVVDFDPVTLYLQELQSCYGDLALFFYDRHGGIFITVLWNPSAFQSQPFKVLQAKSMMPRPGTSSTKEPTMMMPNVEAIVEDFKILGQGLVQSVEIRTEKWVI